MDAAIRHKVEIGEAKVRTEQEEFWDGDFGDTYIARNDSEEIIASNVQLFAKALSKASITSVLEVGANVGMNLAALQLLYPGIDITAIEINSSAATELSRRFPNSRVDNCSVVEAEIELEFDLVLTKGVLIHIRPDQLTEVYRRISRWAKRYVLFAEYYNPSPVSVEYRGHRNRLFKRDFAGEFLDQHPEFELKDYGFVYRRDPVHPLDDITWFILERTRP